MMSKSTTNDNFFMDEDDLDFIDDLLDDEIFSSYITEELDPETMKLLENY
jgi:hypothetical protein